MNATTCDRCGADTAATATTMSYFNTDTICMACRERERAHPKFEEARRAGLPAELARQQPQQSAPGHTPGPWKFDGHGVNANGERIASLAQPSHLDGRKRNVGRDADGALIAAAPDLLAALEELTLWARENTGPRDPNSPHHLLVGAVAALAKAKGTP